MRSVVRIGPPVSAYAISHAGGPLVVEGTPPRLLLEGRPGIGKTGVRSRRDLVGRVFFAHYEPRVRDNERRAIHDQPLRGGPLDTGTSNGR